MSVPVDSIDGMKKTYGKDLYEAGVRVFLVLDFDGVLNSLGEVPFPEGYFGKVFNFDQPAVINDNVEVTFPICYSRQMIKRLNAILADDRVQLCWLTSWHDQVLKPAAHMYMKSARPPVVIPYPDGRLSNQDGKPGGLEIFLFDTPPEAGVVWVDDTLHSGISYTHTELVKQHMARMTQQFLCIGPDDRYGISKAEMTQIEDFVSASLASQDEPVNG